MFTVYVLKSQKTKRLYVGQTNNLSRRLLEHQTRSGHYTSHSGPYELVYSEKFKTRKDAMAREHFFKTGKGREFLANRIGDNTL